MPRIDQPQPADAIDGSWPTASARASAAAARLETDGDTVRGRSEDAADVPVVPVQVGVASPNDEVVASMLGLDDGEWDRTVALVVWATASRWLDVVELDGALDVDPVEHAVGDAGGAVAFEPGVVLDADPGERRDLFTP
jgi:hypothetical protein